jgi:hypothetical protein
MPINHQEIIEDIESRAEKVPGTCEEIDFGHVIHNVTH